MSQWNFKPTKGSNFTLCTIFEGEDGEGKAIARSVIPVHAAEIVALHNLGVTPDTVKQMAEALKSMMHRFGHLDTTPGKREAIIEAEAVLKRCGSLLN